MGQPTGTLQPQFNTLQHQLNTLPALQPTTPPAAQPAPSTLQFGASTLQVAPPAAQPAPSGLSFFNTTPQPAQPATLQAAQPAASSAFALPTFFNTTPQPAQPTTLQVAQPAASPAFALPAFLNTNTPQPAQPAATIQQPVVPAPLSFRDQFVQHLASAHQQTIYKTIQELAGEVKGFSYNCLRLNMHTDPASLANVIAVLEGKLNPSMQRVTTLWNSAKLNPEQQAECQKKLEFIKRKIELIRNTSYMVFATQTNTAVHGVDPVRNVDPIVLDLHNEKMRKLEQKVKTANAMVLLLQRLVNDEQALKGHQPTDSNQVSQIAALLQNRQEEIRKTSESLAKQTSQIQRKVHKFAAFAADYESKVSSNDITKRAITLVRKGLGDIQQSAPRDNGEGKIVDTLPRTFQLLELGGQTPVAPTNVQQPVPSLQQTGVPMNYTVQNVIDSLRQFISAVNEKNPGQISTTFTALAQMPVRSELRLSPEEPTLAHSLGNFLRSLTQGVVPSSNALDLFLAQETVVPHETKTRALSAIIEQMKANGHWTA